MANQLNVPKTTLNVPKTTIREIIEVCERYGALPEQVTAPGVDWSSNIRLTLKVTGIDLTVAAKTLDELDTRLRLLAPLFAEAALKRE
jgi:hypothetical protein